MIYPASPANETARLAMLHALALLDTPAEPVFDALTRLASQLLHTPVALISLVDESRQWFKSNVGLPAHETPRDVAFCAHAIHGPAPFVVEDALGDVRFRDNPLVAGPGPHPVRAYAGVPLTTSEGLALGTLCVIDHQARPFSERDIQALQDLALLARHEILRRESIWRAQTLAAKDDADRAEGNALFRIIFEQAAVGIAMVSLEGQWLQFNAKLCSILGRTPNALLGATFQDITHPEDLSLDLQHVHELLQGHADQYAMEKRYLRPDGEIVWAHLTVALVRRQGEPAYFISVIDDISDRKRAEWALAQLHADLERRVVERTQDLQRSNDLMKVVLDNSMKVERALADSERRLRTIADNVPALIAYVDTQERYRFCNQTYQSWLGVHTEQAIGRTVQEVLGDAPYAVRQGPLRQALGGKASSVDVDVGEGHARRHLHLTYLPDHGADGQVAGIFALGTDVTDARLAQRHLLALASTDSLTGLPNRRAFEDLLGKAIARQHRTGKPLALAFLDVDRFKEINDAHGHGVGDEVLQTFALRLTSCVRASDTVARFGGDEFVILLDGLNRAEECAVVAGKILQATAIAFELSGGLTLSVSTSIGLAYQARPMVTAPDLLEAADEALYAAKEAGRNTHRVKVIEPQSLK